MRQFNIFLIGVLFSHYAFSKELSVTLETVREDQLDALYTESPSAIIEAYRSLNISFQEHRHNEFPRVGSLPTTIKYGELLACNKEHYPTVMLETDGSYEDGRSSRTILRNRLYIFDTTLGLIAYDYSYSKIEVYHRTEEEFSSGKLNFTLANLEEFACNQVEKVLNPKLVEKAFSSKQTYSEYSIGKIQAMFEAYPLSKRNVTQYNNIAYYFEKHKAYEQSVFVLEKVLDQYPTRTVAYINLGDAYWGLDQKDKAKIAYEKYIELMKANGKENRIPKKVLERI